MRIPSIRGNEEGATVVEFAIVALIFITFVVGIVEIGRGFHIRNQMAYAVDRGLRMTYLNSAASDEALKEAIRQNFYGTDSVQLSTTNTSEILDGRSYRLVNSTLPFKMLVPAISSTTISLTVKRRIPI